MIDLTPLDVRNKRGDFKKIMRGYDPQEVDIFLEIVAERLEALVRENIQLRERTQTLQGQVDAQAGREQAVQDALVTAQELRAEMQNQAQREADHIIKEAEVEARQLLAEADAEVRNRLRGVERRLDQGEHALNDLERRRARFLKDFRGLLEREMDVVSVEEGRGPLEDRAIDLDLGASRSAAPVPSPDVPSADIPVEPPVAVETPDAAPAPVDGAAAVEAPTPSPDAPSDPGAAPMAAATLGIAAEGLMSGAEPVETPPVEPATPVEPSMAAEPSMVAEPSMAVEPPPAAEPTVASEAAVTAVAPPTPTDQAVELAERIPEVDVSAVLADMEVPAAPDVAPPIESVTPQPVTQPEATPVPLEELTVDVADLSPESPVAPPPAITPEPSSLELELMAGAEHAGGQAANLAERECFPDVPDLETVLAEAGVEEVRPPLDEEIAPPPPQAVSRDTLLMFDPNDPDRKH